MIKGNLDGPKVIEALNGISIVEGWVVSDGKFKGFDLYSDGIHIGYPTYGIERNDVYRNYPEIKGSEQSGFRHFLKTTDIPDGKHLLEVKGYNVNDETV